LPKSGGILTGLTRLTGWGRQAVFRQEQHEGHEGAAPILVVILSLSKDQPPENNRKLLGGTPIKKPVIPSLSRDQFSLPFPLCHPELVEGPCPPGKQSWKTSIPFISTWQARVFQKGIPTQIRDQREQAR
jgi:hypothetical protein